MNVPQKITTTIDPATPLLGTYKQKMKTLISKDICPLFIAALFPIVNSRYENYLGVNQQMNGQRKCEIYILTTVPPQKSEILPFLTTSMDCEGIVLSEISEKKTNTLGFHLHVESKTKTKKKLIESKLVIVRIGGGLVWVK